jgi:hypothetical protein
MELKNKGMIVIGETANACRMVPNGLIISCFGFFEILLLYGFMLILLLLDRRSDFL